jgi:SAM-dependent methyltransferase
MTEETVFLKSEADAWYRRNATHLTPRELREDIVVKLLRRHKVKPKRVLEIGSSNGWRLELLRQGAPKATYVGIEPSRTAVREGKKVFPKIRLVRGLASALPVKGVFDAVLAPFVLHWVSRAKLLASIAEIDRVVAEGGYLVVSDFLPRTPSKNGYKHLKKGVSTWKMDYGALFEASGNYQLIERRVINYDTKKPANASTPDNIRAAATLYQKKTGVGYVSPI